MITGVSLLPAVCEHIHTRTHAHTPLTSSPWLLSLAAQKGSHPWRPGIRQGKGEGCQGERSRACYNPSWCAGARACVLLRGCACTHTGCQLPFPNRALGNILQCLPPSKLITLSQGPFGAFDPELGEAGKERTGRGWQERNLPCAGPRAPAGADCASELPLAGPTSHRCPHPCSRPSGHSL